MSEKYYRLEACGIKESLSEGTIFGNCDEVSPSKEADEIGLVKFVPVTIPRVGWLPIGDRHKHQAGMVYGLNIGDYMTGFTEDYSIHKRLTHYLPPLPVDGVREEDPFRKTVDSCHAYLSKVGIEDGLVLQSRIEKLVARISELEATGANLTKENLDLENRVDELEESLRKAEAKITDAHTALNGYRIKVGDEGGEFCLGRRINLLANQSPAWQELATFEGECSHGISDESAKRMLGELQAILKLKSEPAYRPKKLVWSDRHRAFEFCIALPMPLITLRIGQDVDDRESSKFVLSRNQTYISIHETLEEAKSAAQSHYDALWKQGGEVVE